MRALQFRCPTMSLSVQERDRSGGMLDSVIPSKGFHGALNGKVDFVRSRKSHYSQVPDQDTLDVGWNDNGHLDMQGQNSKCSKSQWQCGGWNSGQIIEDGVTPCKPVPPKTHASLEDVVNDGGPESQQHPVQHNIDLMDDEMVSWLQPNLQYPLDASLERTFQSDFFSEHSDSTQLLKEFGAVRTMRPPLSGSPVSDANLRAATAEQAMMLGAGRAAGLLPQAGVEVFSKVRTLHSVPPTSSMTRWPQPVNGSNMCATTTMTAAKTSSPSTSNPMLPPKMQPVAQHQSPSPNRPGSMNFSHFSRPAAIVKASLHSLAGSLHPIAAPLPNGQRFKPQMGRPIAEACTSTGSSIAESTTAAQEVKVQLERDQNGMEDSRWQSAPNLSPAKDLASGGECKSATPADQETCRLSGITSDAVLANSSKGVSHVNQHPDIQEPTITSSSGGYGTSAEPPKEASTSTKRKSSERDDTECQSEDGEDESVDTKKPAAGRGNTTKRSRAAEVHNQSERRRRDRINEKMRALQELIPNSNKTDKASMLDEAIEYLKMLQVQLQMMSIRTGMTLPPMVVPSGMQPHMQMPQMPQMAAMPSMGMGMGMGMVPMGLGMGMMDMQQGRAVMPMQSHGGPAMNGNMASTSSLGDVHDYRYQTPVGVMDSYNAYLARQHQPMQMNPQTIGIDKYNAYMLQQHQLQQQQHQQQQQQQQHQQLQPHQQHQHHQQAPNMNGGPPH